VELKKTKGNILCVLILQHTVVLISTKYTSTFTWLS